MDAGFAKWASGSESDWSPSLSLLALSQTFNDQLEHKTGTFVTWHINDLFKEIQNTQILSLTDSHIGTTLVDSDFLI